MENCVVRSYPTGESFYIEAGRYLYEQELLNSFLLTELREKNQKENIYLAVVEKTTGDFLFSVIATPYFVFASSISERTSPGIRSNVVDLLIQSLLSMNLSFQAIHSYEPTLQLIQESMKRHSNKRYVLKDHVWSYSTGCVTWSTKSLYIKNHLNSTLRQITMEDLDLLKNWTRGFAKDDANDDVEDTKLDELCRRELQDKNVYVLYVDNVPVSMGRKRRALRDGVSLSVVYTPPIHRNEGYGGACVSMITETLLKDYKYVTLFVDIKQNPSHNLYTTVGYKLVTEAGRYFAI